MSNVEQLSFFGWHGRTVDQGGRPRTFETAQDIWDAACAYFEWVEANPIITQEKATSDGTAHLIDIPRPRPMTIGGLCFFLGISPQTWANYRERDEFLEVISTIDQAMRTQKFEGAAVGLFNANIISRDLGLADKHQLGGDPANATPVTVNYVVRGYEPPEGEP